MSIFLLILDTPGVTFSKALPVYMLDLIDSTLIRISFPLSLINLAMLFRFILRPSRIIIPYLPVSNSHVFLKPLGMVTLDISSILPCWKMMTS